MGSCCSCASNKISPVDDDDQQPKKVTDNFIRGRGDGESDAEKSKEHSPRLHHRHVSGSSFSSKSCASRSIDELDDDEDDDLLAYLNTNNRGRDVISRYDMLSEVASEVKTEGGLTDVAIDLDHPFAPLYEEDDELNEANLSRPRSVGHRGRSSYTRDLLSQLSNYSDLESLGPTREDTPVPGKRGGSNMSILSKRKHGKKRGNTTSRSKKGYTNQLQREDSDLCVSTPRSYRGSTPGAFSSGSSFTIRTDDGGSSLCSSTSSLSAIGEISECSSVRSAERTKGHAPVKQRRLSKEASNTTKTKENIPPVPPPRPSKRNINPPKSADILGSAKEVEPSTQAPKSADTLLGGRQDSTVGRQDSLRSQLTRQDSNISRSIGGRQDSWRSQFTRQDSILSRTPGIQDLTSGSAVRGYQDGFTGSSKPLNASNRSTKVPNLSSHMNMHLASSSSAWQNQVNLSNNDSDRLNWSSHQANNRTYGKPASASYNKEGYSWSNDRPMAAKPRRPATAIECEVAQQSKKQCYHKDIPENRYSDESMDEESHPDPPKDDKFRTIIII